MSKWFLRFSESFLEDPNVQQALEDLRKIDLLEAYAKEVIRYRVLGAQWTLPTVLAARSLPVTDDVRARIENESDLARLASWLKAAAIATTIDDVFPPG